LDALETRFRKTDILKKEFARNIDGLNEFMNKVESFDAMRKLTGDRKCKSYKKKEVIFSEGNHPGGVYFINKGKVKTFKTNEDGKEYITGLYKEGDFIGYLAVLEDDNFTESAAALEESEVCLIQRQDFISLLYSNREVANKFIKLLTDNLVEKEDRLLSLAYNSVRKRVAEALLMLRDRYKIENRDDFSIHISREDLSNIVGTATESLIRTLSDFKEEGMIELKAGQVKILDARKLEHMKF
jgi:CRP-like cAMP-binding protein